MIQTSNTALLVILCILICLLAFFSLAEAGILSVNRYRLKHLVKVSKGAKRVSELLERPDRLFGVILMGNTFITISASSIGTLIGVDFFGEKMGVIVADIILTFVLLIFAEVSPKTWATLYPEKAAFPSSLFLQFILKLLYPIVWAVNAVSNGFLRLCGVSLSQVGIEQGITREELRTVVHEATGRIPSKHRKMLLSILDLEKVSVDDIMVPRNDVTGIDLENDWEAIVGQLANTQHTFLPVYEGDLNNLIGILHAKKALHLIIDTNEHFCEEKLRDSLDEAFFIPTGTSLTKQLINFQHAKERFALVVDEYGDIIGLITLEDILEEIVGEFTTDMSEAYLAILAQEDGSYLVEGSITIREFNRIVDWKFPSSDAKTMNGIVIEHLQTIPEEGTCCLIGNIPVEVVHVQDNRIKTIKVFPPIHRENA
ncbi:CNNM domain-containing protein [Candidatus Berkiella aquae]|uniref:HlyC/CorC family transporter n=1 Tax=Candidatus Berkiella aquae TaxID=295108 RepID=A0A0Q9YXU1_9GAMM|nr:HlyC/CorC family transporter [Candidatus Berkiella aquae]MCS5712437.1 HlyC/CorC family transporter [Candidatus Berkiella aquae]